MKISIEGNIGCGKSSVISRLCKDERIPVFLEPVDEWKEWLTMFYSDPERWGMSFNINVLLTFNKWKNNEFFAVYERSPVSNRYVFTKLQHDQGGMNALELKMFERLYDRLAWTPDLVVYINTTPEVSMDRMQKRARACENAVPLEYLTAVHNKYEEIFNAGSHTLPHEYVPPSSKPCRVVVVDGNRPHDEVYEDVLKIIHQYAPHPL